MVPDTSQWRDQQSYDLFDALEIEGLAWECLRRDTEYQSYYRSLSAAKSDAEPLDREAERRWGLRFPGTAKLVRLEAEHLLVAFGQPGHCHSRQRT